MKIDLSMDDRFCCLSVADNGDGLLVAVKPRDDAFGLLGMRERAAQIGGELAIESLQATACRPVWPRRSIESRKINNPVRLLAHAECVNPLEAAAMHVMHLRKFSASRLPWCCWSYVCVSEAGSTFCWGRLTRALEPWKSC